MNWGRGVFIGNNNQSERSCVAARVAAHLALDACAAAPRAPHVWLHDQDFSKFTPRIHMSDARPGCMQIDTIISTCQSACFSRRWNDTLCFCVSLGMLWSFVLQHLMLPFPHTLLGIATTSWSHRSSHLKFLGPFVWFWWIFDLRSIPNILLAHSDALNIFNKLQINPELEIKYFPNLLSKNSIIPKSGFLFNFGVSRRVFHPT